MFILSSIRQIFLDIDGVLLDDKKLIPGVDEALSWFIGRGIEIILITNNVNRYKEDTLSQLQFLAPKYNFRLIDPIDVLEKLSEYSDIKSKAVYVVGTDIFKERLKQLGINVVDNMDFSAVPSTVLIGSSTKMVYNELAYITQLIYSGVDFWATGQERVFRWRGNIWPATGALLAFIETASNRKANILGKPSKRIFDVAFEGGIGRDETLVIGDDIDVDIAGAANFGLKSILVMSGVTSKDVLLLSNHKPDFVVNNLSDVINIFHISK